MMIEGSPGFEFLLVMVTTFILFNETIQEPGAVIVNEQTERTIHFTDIPFVSNRFKPQSQQKVVLPKCSKVTNTSQGAAASQKVILCSTKSKGRRSTRLKKKLGRKRRRNRQQRQRKSGSRTPKALNPALVKSHHVTPKPKQKRDIVHGTKNSSQTETIKIRRHVQKTTSNEHNDPDLRRLALTPEYIHVRKLEDKNKCIVVSYDEFEFEEPERPVSCDSFRLHEKYFLHENETICYEVRRIKVDQQSRARIVKERLAAALCKSYYAHFPQNDGRYYFNSKHGRCTKKAGTGEHYFKSLKECNEYYKNATVKASKKISRRSISDKKQYSLYADEQEKFCTVYDNRVMQNPVGQILCSEYKGYGTMLTQSKKCWELSSGIRKRASAINVCDIHGFIMLRYVPVKNTNRCKLRIIHVGGKGEWPNFESKKECLERDIYFIWCVNHCGNSGRKYCRGVKKEECDRINKVGASGSYCKQVNQRTANQLRINHQHPLHYVVFVQAEGPHKPAITAANCGNAKHCSLCQKIDVWKYYEKSETYACLPKFLDSRKKLCRKVIDIERWNGPNITYVNWKKLQRTDIAKPEDIIIGCEGKKCSNTAFCKKSLTQCAVCSEKEIEACTAEIKRRSLVETTPIRKTIYAPPVWDELLGYSNQQATKGPCDRKVDLCDLSRHDSSLESSEVIPDDDLTNHLNEEDFTREAFAARGVPKLCLINGSMDDGKCLSSWSFLIDLYEARQLAQAKNPYATRFYIKTGPWDTKQIFVGEADNVFENPTCGKLMNFAYAHIFKQHTRDCKRKRRGRLVSRNNSLFIKFT